VGGEAKKKNEGPIQKEPVTQSLRKGKGKDWCAAENVRMRCDCDWKRVTSVEGVG